MGLVGIRRVCRAVDPRGSVAGLALQQEAGGRTTRSAALDGVLSGPGPARTDPPGNAAEHIDLSGLRVQ
jgi:hypothetical protein